MPSQKDIKEQLRQDIATVESGPKRRTIKDMLEDPERQLEIAKALPTAMTPARFTRILLNACNDQPNLLRCDSNSLLAAGMQCAALGLEPNTALQHCWLLPFAKNSNGERHHVVQFILGYRGIIDLALRNNRVQSVEASPVFEKDEFEIDKGSDKRLRHVPYLDGDPGEVRFYYAISHFTNGGYTFRPVPLWEIEEHRQASKAPDSPAWRQWPRAMAMKTAVRMLSPFIPLSSDAARGIQADESTPEYGEFFTGDGKAIETNGQEQPDPIDIPEQQELVDPTDICDTCGAPTDAHEPECPAAPFT